MKVLCSERAFLYFFAVKLDHILKSPLRKENRPIENRPGSGPHAQNLGELNDKFLSFFVNIS